MAKSDGPTVIIRPARATDVQAWYALWRGYCAELGGTVPEMTSEGIWQHIHILARSDLIGCLLAYRSEGEPVGFANYVLHPHTWSLQSVCYLEDLFIVPEARGTGAGRALIEALAVLGKQKGWRRIYWHTHEDNYRARILYDRLATQTDYVRYDIEL